MHWHWFDPVEVEMIQRSRFLRGVAILGLIGSTVALGSLLLLGLFVVVAFIAGLFFI